ncbi:MAG: hypothetical protein QNJ51_11435 [Calothrix sp. MO_167.B12]|nr:hypothetical protein [Calothrix sp. MO_167.B12]
MANTFQVELESSRFVGKLKKVDTFCKSMPKQYNLAMPTDDIYTWEDTNFFVYFLDGVLHAMGHKSPKKGGEFISKT